MVILSALWLGVLTSLSPCPLTTNIAAVSFVSKRPDSTWKVMLHGLGYTLGRTTLYILLGLLLKAGMTNAPGISSVLQQYGVYVQIPLMLVIGLVLLDVITLSKLGTGIKAPNPEKMEKRGLLGSFSLGFVFACMFCPVSAALFFGSLMQENAGVLSIIAYGVGTGLPVMMFALLIAFGVAKIGTIYNRIKSWEKWARRITGIIFIAIGLYSIKYLF